MVYRNSDISRAIDEYIHSDWQREAMKMRFCDGKTYEQIAEALGYSTQYIKEIVSRNKKAIFSNL